MQQLFVFYGKAGQREEKVENEAETVLKGESYNTAILACGKNELFNRHYFHVFLMQSNPKIDTCSSIL